MLTIAHTTRLDSAVRIVEGGFDPVNFIPTEAGANFFHTEDELGANDLGYNKQQCTLLFEWHGQVVTAHDIEKFEDNILYNARPWRMFISRCDNEQLVFKRICFLEEIFHLYDCSIFERLRYGSRKRACIEYFGSRMDRPVLVRSRTK
jgi:hypothetical protein